MDEASLRRGQQTVHIKYDSNTALLVGDVMLIRAYEFLQTIQPQYLPKILKIFNYEKNYFSRSKRTQSKFY